MVGGGAWWCRMMIGFEFGLEKWGFFGCWGWGWSLRSAARILRRRSVIRGIFLWLSRRWVGGLYSGRRGWGGGGRRGCWLLPG